MGNRVSTNTLVSVGTIGGILGAGVAFQMLNRMVDDVRSAQYYTSALSALREHPAAQQVLGEPIRDFRFNSDETDNFCDGSKAHFHVPVLGPRCAGDYYFWAERESGEFWVVTRAELARRAHPDKRLVLVDVKKDTNI